MQTSIPAHIKDTSEGQEAEAEYTLENPVKCPHCGEQLEVLKVVRLLRTRVNLAR